MHYIERIGKQPGPMLEDYVRVITDAIVHVAVRANRVVGAIVLMVTEEGFYVDNVAVRPSAKGIGVGRTLLELAESEARRRGYKSIYLATHELMAENNALRTSSASLAGAARLQWRRLPATLSVLSMRGLP